LVAALGAGADAVRGAGRPDVSGVLAALAGGFAPGADAPTADEMWGALVGVLAADDGGPEGDDDQGPRASVLPDRLAPLMALTEVLPAPVAEQALVEIVARVSEPHAEAPGTV
ncbi:hypothetical protein G8C60_13555, partial [Cellulosimicrobium cellulans]|nr:hypothetical protein [Cellulosimicrobium cellulans]